MRELHPFKVDVERIPGGYLLRAVGEFDYGVVDRLDKAFTDIGARSGDRVVLDLRDVTLVDSSGLAAIIGFHTRSTHEHFEFVIVRPPKQVMRVFELTTIDRWLTIVDDYEPAEPGQVGADLDELSRRLERSQKALQARRPVAAPGDPPPS